MISNKQNKIKVTARYFTDTTVTGCVKNRKVAGLIPAGVIGIFH